MKRILHLISAKNITFKSAYNWFKIDILRLVRPLTTIFSPVLSHLNYFTHIIKARTMCKTRFESQRVFLHGFSTICFWKTLMALEIPPPLMAKVIKNYLFFWNPSPWNNTNKCICNNILFFFFRFIYWSQWLQLAWLRRIFQSKVPTSLISTQVFIN